MVIDQEDLPEPEAEPEDLGQALDMEIIDSALAKLRPNQQKVLQLHVHEGLTHREIAQVTGFPLGTVKTYARRGLMKLRELLNVGGDQE